MKPFLYVLGVIFVIVGLIGFFNNPVMGIFQVDTANNIIHILTGLIAVTVANNANATALFGKIMAVVYGLVTILGFISTDGTVLGIMMVNAADNILHLFLTIIFIYVGFAKTVGTRVKI